MKNLLYLLFFMPILSPAQQMYDLQYDTDANSTYQLTLTRDNEILRKEYAMAEDSIRYSKNNTLIYPTTKDRSYHVSVIPQSSQTLEILIQEASGPATYKITDSLHQKPQPTSSSNQTPWLQAVIDSKGHLKSFYRESETKEFVNLLFSLPEHSVLEGASWKLPINFIKVGPNIQVNETLQQNQATLESVTEEDGRQIATIIFNIQEQIQGTLHSDPQKKLRKLQVDYQGKGTFDITSGHWVQIHTSLLKTSDFPFMIPEDTTTYNLMLLEE